MRRCHANNGGLTECETDSRGMIVDSFDDPILEIDRISKELDRASAGRGITVDFARSEICVGYERPQPIFVC